MDSASAEASYRAFARADGFEQSIANPSIPTGIAIEGGGPAATARQDNIGLRDASAQFPYAGETVPGLPGTGAALFGFPVPAYPFISATNAGSPPSKVTYPGVTLYSESGDFSTLASGLVGDAATVGAESVARIDEARNGDVTATASTAGSGFTLGTYGSLSDVRSGATVIANSTTGEITRTTSTSIGRISAPGLNIDIPGQTPGAVPIPVPIPGVPNPDPLAFPPFPVPAGGETLHDPDIGIQNGFFTVTQLVGGEKRTYAIPSDSALEGFKQAGLTISFQAPEETDGGVVAGAYRFTYTAPAPPENTNYNGTTVFTQSTALVVANVDLRPIDADVAPSLPVGGTDSAAGTAALPQADSIGNVGAIAPVAPGAVPGSDIVSLSSQPGATAAGSGLLGGADDIYLVVVLVAALGFLATMALSALGARP
jgi:hypothetical protein